MEAGVQRALGERREELAAHGRAEEAAEARAAREAAAAAELAAAEVRGV